MNLLRPNQTQTAWLHPRSVVCLGLILILPNLFLCGCSHLAPSRSKDKAEVKTLQSKNTKPGTTTLSALQSDVMRFADDYASTIAQAAEDYAESSTNADIRVAALRWKLEQAGAAYINAAGRNPILNALDMVVLATLSRMVIESLARGAVPEDQALTLLQTHRQMETNAWDLVQGVLKPGQKKELSDIMQEWRRNNPNQKYVGGIRFRQFASDLANAPQTAKSKPTSVFNLLFIDPMAGLDPTARAIEETRQSAERITYYAQRAPILLSWQAQLLTYQLADQPAARQLLTDAERLGKSAEAFARTVDKLPDLLDQQREAAIKQFFDGIANERTNLVASLVSEEEKARALLAETRETLSAGSQMASSVDGAVQSLHSFVRFVSPSLASNAVPSVVSTNKRPFNVLDYGTAATQVGAMAADLNTLLTSANQSMPQAARLGQQAGSEAQALIDHAFRLGLFLLLVLLVGSLAAALGYRFLSLKLARRFQFDQMLQPRQNGQRGVATERDAKL